jgi:K+-sensing histidine kinase KdpD
VPPRTSLGLVVGGALVAAVTAALLPFRHDVSRATPALLLVLPVVVVGVVGSRRTPALVTAVLAAVAFNVAFVPPAGTFKVDALDDGVALAVFVIVAVVVGALMAAEADRRQTAERRADELAALHHELAAVDAERARLAEEATRVAVLERVDEQRAALLRSVSHDLRTPLATIRAVTSDLRDGVSYDEATRAELLDLVGDETERLDRLVANLLSLSRIEAGAFRPERQAVAVGEVVEHCTRRLGRLFRQVRLQVEVRDDLPLVDADYSQVDQVLSNLLENAARHSPPASTVRIGAGAEGDHVQVWVEDEGTGIPPFERERVFEPFRRGQGSSSSGVGLAICKAVVEAHGGAIGVEEAPGGGARFVFTLPVRRG